MLQLIDMAMKRRDAVIVASKGIYNKDFCGYDTRLGTVGVTYQFGVYLQTPEGEAIFKAGRLDAPQVPTSADTTSSDTATTNGTYGEAPDPLTAGMCTKKKCKPHHGWQSLLTKMVKHDMRELASEAKEKLDREHHVRNSAARRWKRKQRENNSVHYYKSTSKMDEA
jgi:COMPASS component SPP1